MLHQGVGMTPRQSLFTVELPLALPIIMAGVRTAAVWVIGTATLSTPIGQTSLGNYIFTGLQTQNWVFVLFGCAAAAVLALAVDLVWGFCGILSLGHGAFFALGGYCMGMYLMRQIGSRGVYGNPLLPDFMVFLNYKELPWFWYGFDNFGFAMLMAILVPSVLAFALGWFAFRSRVTGLYLSIIPQAMTFASMGS